MAKSKRGRNQEPVFTKLSPSTWERAQIIDEEAEDYYWCLDCERAYPAGWVRLQWDNIAGDSLQLCPYDGCGGDTVMDARRWSEIRDVHPEYPEIPEWDHLYPMYG